jgi:Putative transmembrane protein (PGPGW)
MTEHPPEADPAPMPEQQAVDAAPAADAPTPAPEPEAPANLTTTLPKELGVMLVSAGIIGVVLPGPGTPVLVAGGLILWPEAFGRVERWFQKRFPETHRMGVGHINRFLTDLERRYPGSTGTASSEPVSERS